jgi:hypothetical protein
MWLGAFDFCYECVGGGLWCEQYGCGAWHSGGHGNYQSQPGFWVTNADDGTIPLWSLGDDHYPIL